MSRLSSSSSTALPSTALPPIEPLLLSEADAARMCSVSLVTFRKWVADGRINKVFLPDAMRRNLYRRDELVAFVQRLTDGDA